MGYFHRKFVFLDQFFPTKPKFFVLPVFVRPLKPGWLGGSVGWALARDRKVASSTPGQSATE